MAAFIGLAVISVLALVFFFFSVRSRRRYECPECGERVMVEHMTASRCNMCGAELQETTEQ